MWWWVLDGGHWYGGWHFSVEVGIVVLRCGNIKVRIEVCPVTVVQCTCRQQSHMSSCLFHKTSGVLYASLHTCTSI